MKEDVVEGMKDFFIEIVHLNLKGCFIYYTHCFGVIMNLIDDNEDEQSCVETPTVDVGVMNDDIPMADEWR